MRPTVLLLTLAPGLASPAAAQAAPRDAAGEVTETQYLRASRDVWFERVVAPGSRWTLVIEGHDTHFGGKYPGNGGRVRAHVIAQPKR